MSQRFTLVVPTYNESAIIAETLDVLRTAFSNTPGLEWSIIVADNASHDGTADIVQDYNDTRISVLRLEEKGRGRAVRAGFKAAGAGIVAFTDADLSVTPSEILAAYRLIADNECDVLIGTRYAEGKQRAERSWWRTLSSRTFLYLAQRIVGVHASDTQCPLKMANDITREVMISTEDNTWFNDLEFVAYAEQLGLRMREFPVAWDEGRYSGRRSKLKLLKDGVNAIKTMFKIRRMLPQQVKKLKEKLTI